MPNVLIRNVPPDVQDTLKVRAERRGQSLQQYLLDELVQLAAKPTVAELMDRVEAELAVEDPIGTSSFDSLAALHEARAEREAQLDERDR